MTHLAVVSSWTSLVSTHLPHLSRPQIRILAWWSFAMVLTQRSGLTTVSMFLAMLLDLHDTNIRERMRSWYRRSQRHQHRRRMPNQRTYQKHPRTVDTCFAPLLRWILAWWEPNSKRIVIALDASTLGQRFTVLAVCVVIRGCAIPIAWKIVRATKKGAWKPHWCDLLESLDGVIPEDWCVLVVADRGLYARWLFHAIVRNHWHPFLRINRQGQFAHEDATTFQMLRQIVMSPGQRWAGRVACFKTRERQLACTLVGSWSVGYREPWLIVTDLPPNQVDAAGYAMHAWIACGFKDSKRDGWHWEQTKMVDPERAEWLWFAMSIATLWTVGVGCAHEERTTTQQKRKNAKKDRREPRMLSCFRLGQIVILSAVIRGKTLPAARLVPEPWPKSLDTLQDRSSPHSKAA